MTATMRIRDLPATAVAHPGLNPLEEDFTDWVIDRAKEHGWLVAHFRPARTSKGFRTPVQGDKGSPDLLLARPGDLVLAELKRNGTYPDPDQRAWLAALGPHGVVWRPRDAETVLRRLSRPSGTGEGA